MSSKVIIIGALLVGLVSASGGFVASADIADEAVKQGERLALNLPPYIPEDYELLTLSPDEFVAEAQKGSVELETQGRTWVMSLYQYDLVSPDANLIVDGEEIPYETPAPAAFLGEFNDVEGTPGFVVEDDAVSGMLIVPEGTIKLVPAYIYNPAVPKDWVLSFWLQDTDLTFNIGSTNMTAKAREPFFAEGEDVVSVASVSDKTMIARGDHTFYNHFGSPGWYQQMNRVMGEVNTIFQNSVGFKITIDFHIACTTQSCDQGRGLDTTDPLKLMGSLGNYCKNEDTEMCHLWIDRDVDNVLGMGDIPGRKSIGQTLPSGSYDGRDYWMNSEIVAHEMGHNYCGIHSDYDIVWSGGSWKYTIMREPWSANNMAHEFSNNVQQGWDNEGHIKDANQKYNQVSWGGSDSGVCRWDT